MRKDAIWLISGGPMQALAAKEIKNQGYALIISDKNPQAICRELADCFVTIDTFDIEGHLLAADKLSSDFNIKAVLTVAADCHLTVACTGQHLGVHHLSPEISRNCRNKLETRKLLSQAGLTQPSFHAASSYDQALKVLSQHPNLPFVIKATDNSGSRGFSTIPLGHTLSQKQFESALESGTTGLVILEEALQNSPDEISEASVETLWIDGKMHWLNWVDRIFSRDLKFFPGVTLDGQVGAGVELGHINPANHSPALQAQIKEQIEKAGQALGMDQQSGGHVLKADIFFSIAGPIILELTPRLSGGWDSSGSSPARGANVVGGVIKLALGEAMTPTDWDKFFKFNDNTAVVMSEIQPGAEDCIGRKFALAQGPDDIAQLINKAVNKLQEGEYLVPIL